MRSGSRPVETSTAGDAHEEEAPKPGWRAEGPVETGTAGDRYDAASLEFADATRRPQARRLGARPDLTEGAGTPRRGIAICVIRLPRGNSAGPRRLLTYDDERAVHPSSSPSPLTHIARISTRCQSRTSPPALHDRSRASGAPDQSPPAEGTFAATVEENYAATRSSCVRGEPRGR